MAHNQDQICFLHPPQMFFSATRAVGFIFFWFPSDISADGAEILQRE